jgi:RND family efflux transporter MFP subunit
MFLAAFAGPLTACGKSAAPDAAERRGSRPDTVQVRTTAPQRIHVQRQVELAGTLLSPDQARVSTEVAGPVVTVLVELGSEVRRGDPLVRLDRREFELALERAESALRQSQAQLGLHDGRAEAPAADEAVAAVRTAEANRDDARAALDRAQRLAGRGLLAQVELQNAETRLKVAEAAYQAALDSTRSLRAGLQDRRAAVDLARKKLDDTTVRAPIAGLVSERLVQPGEFIRENTPVVTIVQVHPLKLRTAVQEKYASVIAAGLPVRFRVESLPGVRFEGKVAYVSPAVDSATRTFVVEALVDNHDRRLKPGFFAEGIIETRLDENVIAVPEEAISTLAGVSAVFVIEDGKARQQQVAVGVKQGSLVEITEGLQGDEVLAASNLGQLATGTLVSTSSRNAAGPRPQGAANGSRQRSAQ